MPIPLKIPNRIYKPLKPQVRHLKDRKRLTTVIAIKCKNDEIVLCSDGQASSELGIKETFSKITQLGYDEERNQNCVLGCAGDLDYIKHFRRHLEAAFSHGTTSDYFNALNEAVNSYDKFFADKMANTNLDFTKEMPLEVIFAGYNPSDSKCHAFSIYPPNHPTELFRELPYRHAIGSGSVFATILLQSVDHMMSKVSVEWNELSSKLVLQFCYFLIGRVFAVDLYSGLSPSFWKVDKTGAHLLSPAKIFSEQGEADWNKYRLPIFVSSLWEELLGIRRKELADLMREYRFDKLLERLLGDFRV